MDWVLSVRGGRTTHRQGVPGIGSSQLFHLQSKSWGLLCIYHQVDTCTQGAPATRSEPQKAQKEDPAVRERRSEQREYTLGKKKKLPEVNGTTALCNIYTREQYLRRILKWGHFPVFYMYTLMLLLFRCKSDVVVIWGLLSFSYF